MKCAKCGGNLTLEDVVCPYCEALNEHAVEHIREMNRYKKDYEGTKQDVYSVTKNYAGITVRIIIIAVLLVLIVICGLLSGEAYSIRRKITVAQRNEKECIEIMEQYLADREYYAMAVFCETNSINAYEEGFEEYNSIIYAVRHYRYIYDMVMRTLRPYEGADMQNNIGYIADYMNDFYKIFDENTDAYYYVGDSQESLEAAQGMKEQLEALLMAYCGLTKEDVESLQGMTEAERALLIEERMTDGE
ncbi:MAG: hypothetical protein IJ379_06685 [Lachnospiraceae bacterium]|nr:hypothetical protein [Lachnospiraceae bacterium]